jgi:hypothetical protein
MVKKTIAKTDRKGKKTPARKASTAKPKAAKSKATKPKAQARKVWVTPRKVQLKPKLRTAKPAAKTAAKGLRGWIAGLFGAIAVIGVGTLMAQRPSELPAPVQRPPQAQPVQQAQAEAQPQSVAPVAGVDTPQGIKPGMNLPNLRRTSPPTTGPMAEQFVEAFPHSMSERVAYWSAYLSKLQDKSAHPGKELAKNLGGVPEIADSAPLVPNDFDCTTFVETVAALSRSASAVEFFQNLTSIRYKDGYPSFNNRNHFPEADWIPNNEQAKNIRDITTEVAHASGFEPSVKTKQINRGKWLAEQKKSGRVSRSLASVDPSWDTPVEAKVNYIPIEKLGAALANIPSGSVVNLVRENSPEHPVLIGHQGLIIREGDKVLIRHSSVQGHIRTLDLKQYLDSISEKGDAHGWALVGINLNQIQN